MSTVIDEFMVKMKLDGKEWAQDAKEVEQSIKGVKEELKDTESAGQSFGGMADGLKTKLLGLASAFAALYGVQQTFTNYLTQADQLLKFSRAIGQNVEDVDAWGQAVQRSGGTAEGFQGTLKTLTTQLSKMATTGKSRTGNILEKAGIDAGSIGRQRKAFDVLLEVADKMQGMSKEEAFGFGSSLGLDSGTIMMLQQGRDAVGDLVGKMKELGTITNDDKWVEDFNDGIEDIKKSFMSVGGIIFRDLGPGFLQVIQWAKDINKYLLQHEVAVKAFFTGLATIITAKLIPAFASLFKTLAKNPYTWVVIGLAAIALAIEDLYTWATGGDAAFGEFWEAIFGSKDEALQFFEDMKGLANDVLYIVKELAAAWRELKDAYHNFTDNGGSARLIVGADGDINAFGDEYHDALQEKFSTIYDPATMGYSEGVKNNIGNFYDAFIGSDALIEVEQASAETGKRSGELFTEEFGNSIDNFLIDWNDNGFFEAWEHDSEETKEAVTRHFAEQGKAISATGQDIDTLNAKLDALRQNILTMPVYNPSMAFAGGATYNSANTRIGAINVNTQATDASGIGASIAPVVRSGFNPYKSNGGAW